MYQTFDDRGPRMNRERGRVWQRKKTIIVFFHSLYLLCYAITSARKRQNSPEVTPGVKNSRGGTLPIHGRDWGVHCLGRSVSPYGPMGYTAHNV